MTAYVTFADFRAYMDALTQGRPASYSEADQTFINGALAAATEFVERETGRRFAARSQTRYYGRDSISLTTGRLNLDTDLLSVTTLTNGDGSTIPAGGYRLWPRNAERFDSIELRSGHAWQWGTDGEVEIAGQWGYSLAPTEDVKRVICRLAYLEQMRRTATGEVNILEGGFQFDTVLPRDIAEWIRKMNRGRVG